jgi:hypothetical protein
MSPEKNLKNLFTLYFEDKLCASIFIVTGFPNSIFMPFLPSTDFTSIFHMCNDVTGHHLPFSGTWIQPRFLVGSWCSSFCFQLVVFFLCFLCTMLPVSLDCEFLIAPSVFSNIYFIEATKKRLLPFL